MNIPKDLVPVEARENALKKVSELLSRHPDGIPLDPEVDMKVRIVFPSSTLQLLLSFTCLRTQELSMIFYLIRFGAALTKRQFVGWRLWKTYSRNTRLRNLPS